MRRPAGSAEEYCLSARSQFLSAGCCRLSPRRRRDLPGSVLAAAVGPAASMLRREAGAGAAAAARFATRRRLLGRERCRHCGTGHAQTGPTRPRIPRLWSKPEELLTDACSLLFPETGQICARFAHAESWNAARIPVGPGNRVTTSCNSGPPLCGVGSSACRRMWAILPRPLSQWFLVPQLNRDSGFRSPRPQQPHRRHRRHSPRFPSQRPSVLRRHDCARGGLRQNSSITPSCRRWVGCRPPWSLSPSPSTELLATAGSPETVIGTQLRFVSSCGRNRRRSRQSGLHPRTRHGVPSRARQNPTARLQMAKLWR
jgi:hypothetical protein